MKDKAKLALYWASSCGGCEIAVLELEEKILDVAAAFDIVFWPVAIDFKVKDVEAMADGEIDLCLFNGAVRNSDNEEMAKLLRAKSKILVAFGSCAYEGCIPALSNTTSRAATLDWVYRDSPSTPNPGGVRPQTATEVHLGGNGKTAEIRLPELYDTVYTLDQTVDVDYYVPGCPPQAHQIQAVLETVVDCLQNDKPLPPKGAVLGAGDKTCCDECPRERKERKIKRFVRPHQIIPDPELCLLDQGLVCMGPATRSGCGGLCVAAGVPCRGCYGPPPAVSLRGLDQGTKMISALASVIDSQDPEEIEEILDGIVDPIGTFYRFSMSKATLGRARTPKEAHHG